MYKDIRYIRVMHIYDRFYEFARTAASLFLALELGYDSGERGEGIL